MPDAHHEVTRFAADLVDAAVAEGARQSRSAKQQLDHWARVGRAVSGFDTAARRRVEAALAGQLPMRALTVEEGVAFNAEVSAAIEEKLAVTHYGRTLAAEGVATVALDDDASTARTELAWCCRSSLEPPPRHQRLGGARGASPRPGRGTERLRQVDLRPSHAHPCRQPYGVRQLPHRRATDRGAPGRRNTDRCRDVAGVDATADSVRAAEVIATSRAAKTGPNSPSLSLGRRPVYRRRRTTRAPRSRRRSALGDVGPLDPLHAVPVSQSSPFTKARSHVIRIESSQPTGSPQDRNSPPDLPTSANRADVPISAPGGYAPRARDAELSWSQRQIIRGGFTCCASQLRTTGRALAAGVVAVPTRPVRRRLWRNIWPWPPASRSTWMASGLPSTLRTRSGQERASLRHSADAEDRSRAAPAPRYCRIAQHVPWSPPAYPSTPAATSRGMRRRDVGSGRLGAGCCVKLGVFAA